MEVIVIETAAFDLLVEKVISRLSKNEPTKDSKWISGKETMKLLRIRSTSTLQNLRDSHSIIFSKLTRKLIVYDRGSIEKYIEEKSKKGF